MATAAEQSRPQLEPLPVKGNTAVGVAAAAAAAAEEQVCFLGTAPAHVYRLAGMKSRRHVNIVFQSISRTACANADLLSCCMQTAQMY